ncbi:outer membrane lipoprotein carrier protein LolA [Pseudoxanthomonas kalamensis DSM 18571]|uniref:outer membrane lipoprotein chaperone LolA n=1 Tax=Pseudoxanthomonas kalamensis TaxID=289483 RepID=UPI001391CD69|nr:outer membrane lipoprotein chaperone LolA [Pseudoxanthomonas kalamensis]KAF1709753.1 outer membrane lipoprotein carrier protein LolA [Pseudoxanthomonas kalamensis DSM 18571]
MTPRPTFQSFLSILLLCASGLMATDAQAGGRERLHAFTDGLNGLQGDFSQQVSDRGGRLKESSTGHVAFSVPRHFRWEYVKPYEQLIVADGDKVWIYEPDLLQVSVRNQGQEEQNSPLAVLLDPSALDRQFEVVERDAGENGLDWLLLTPKDPGGANFQSARLGFDATGLARMVLVDAVGQETRIAFTDWKRNPRFAADAFRFVPPDGVDVVGDP